MLARMLYAHTEFVTIYAKLLQ